jgi:hypothetical protein
MAYGDAREGTWRRNWPMEWVASTLHTTSELGVSKIDIHTNKTPHSHRTNITNTNNRSLFNQRNNIYGSFWFSYILFITIIGGILVLFIYIAKLASNEIFSPSNKILITSSIMLPVLIYRVFNLKVYRILTWIIYLLRFTTCYVT